MNQGNNINTHSTLPVRPPPPDSARLAELQQQKNIKSKVGGTPRNIRSADIPQARQLTVQQQKVPEDNDTKKSLSKTLKQRAITVYQNTKIRLQNKKNDLKEKASHLNEVKKEWSKAKLTNTAALAAEAFQTGKNKAKKAYAHKKEQSKNIYASAKAGVQTWRGAKTETTLAVTSILYQSSKKTIKQKAKSLANYSVTKPKKIIKKLASLPSKIKNIGMKTQSLKNRSCSVIQSNPK